MSAMVELHVPSPCYLHQRRALHHSVSIVHIRWIWISCSDIGFFSQILFSNPCSPLAHPSTRSVQVVAKGPVWEAVTLEGDFCSIRETDEFVARVPGALSLLVELNQVRCGQGSKSCRVLRTICTENYKIKNTKVPPVHGGEVQGNIWGEICHEWIAICVIAYARASPCLLCGTFTAMWVVKMIQDGVVFRSNSAVGGQNIVFQALACSKYCTSKALDAARPVWVMW